MIKALVVASALLLAGCANLAYYSQAVGGHLRVMNTAHPIGDLLQAPSTDPDLKRKLEEVSAIREFASRELALPDNNSYRAYADLGRPYVVWNVFAAPEFSVEPEKWCMPFVGCVNYRGYYDRADADRYADELRRQGLDTFVGGITAYSTLGLFDDPVLNTFLRLGNAEVARTVFHELAHQRLYVKDDTVFNESFAAAVESEGLRRWLARNVDPAQQGAFAARRQRKVEFLRLVETYRDKLRALYAAPLPDEEKRRAKRETLAEMARDYAALKAAWGGDAGYDKWFDPDFNNARIAALALYTRLAPAFEALLEQEDHDLPRFYRRVEALAHLPKAERTEALGRLLLMPPAVPPG